MKQLDFEVQKKVDQHAAAVDKWCAEHNTCRIFTALYGSQNYNLNSKDSDVDTHSLVVAPLRDWLWGDGNKYDVVIDMPDGSKASIKSCADMFKQYIKGNINFLETLFTMYINVASGFQNIVDELHLHADKIARHNMYKQASVWFGYIAQMMLRTNHLRQEDKEAPYNRKAFMSAMRLKVTFIRWFHTNMMFDEAIDMTQDREYLLGLKTTVLPENAVKQQLDDLESWIEDEKMYINHWFKDQEIFNAESYFKMLCIDIYDTVRANGLSY